MLPQDQRRRPFRPSSFEEGSVGGKYGVGSKRGGGFRGAQLRWSEVKMSLAAKSGGVKMGPYLLKKGGPLYFSTTAVTC